MFAHTALLALCALATAALGKPSVTPSHSTLTKRLAGQSVAFACYGGGGDCECPVDLMGDSGGVLINVYPGFQCAYAGGACTWDDKTGALQNTGQTNCPAVSACSTSSGCECPVDLNGDTGVMINQFTGYQCAYVRGACTWDYLGNLQNLEQTNCPNAVPCAQLVGDA